MTKANIPTEMSKGQSDNTNNAPKKFDYTAIADPLRSISWMNYRHTTGVVYRFYRAHLPTHRNSWFKHYLFTSCNIVYIINIHIC